MVERGASAGTKPNSLELIFFAGGDFAFNLYWQSVMLFLLFYYSDSLGLPIETATAIYAAASVWDGIVNFAMGLLIERWPHVIQRRGWLLAGSVPLALAFVATYAPPFLPGAGRLVTIMLAHLAFRTAYAALNVPYLAMGARISRTSEDRALVAGARMIFGTIAWVLVARGTLPIGRALAHGGGPKAYVSAAAVFAGAATLLLALVAWRYRPVAAAIAPARPSLREMLTAVARNRAALTLYLAMMAMIMAVTVLNKSILYYFKYFTNDADAGEAALGWMGVAGAVALPCWIALQRRLGTRALWFLAAGACMLGLMFFALVPLAQAWAMELFLVAMQMAMAGLHFTFWAMLPDTIEYGERATGLRVEGVTFGLAALLQRVAIGAATLLLGAGFTHAGFLANTAQHPATLAAMRATIALVPLAFLGLSVAAMWANPLGRGVHARIVAELDAR